MNKFMMTMSYCNSSSHPPTHLLTYFDDIYVFMIGYQLPCGIQIGDRSDRITAL